MEISSSSSSDTSGSSESDSSEKRGKKRTNGGNDALSPPSKKGKKTADDKSGTTVMPAFPLDITIDCTIEVYPFGYTKRSYHRETVVSLEDLFDKDLPSCKNEIRAKYGVLADAERCAIGDFQLDLGVKTHGVHGDCDKVYTAQSQAEWENLLAKMKNNLANHSVVGNRT